MRLPILILASALIGATGVCIGRGVTVSAIGSTTPQRHADLDAMMASAIDPSVDACIDSYQHACGGFIAATKLEERAPSISMTGRAFDANLERGLKSLFARPIPGDPELHRLETFHRSCLCNDVADDRAVVKQWLDRIAAARSVSDMKRLSRDLSAIGVDAFFTYSGQADRAHWSRYRGEIDGLYLWGKAAVVTQAFVDTGESRPDAERDAGAVVTMIAALNAKRGDRYDAKTAEHPQSLAELERLAPAIDWPAFFDAAGAPRDQAVNVVSPDHLRAVQQLLMT